MWALPFKKRLLQNVKCIAKHHGFTSFGKSHSKTMMMMKAMFCQSKSNTLPKLAKVLIDKSREFSYIFSHLCQQKDIGLHSTHSESNLAFAERHIRSLKAKFFKFLHENNTDKYFEKLQQFVTVINCRVNRITKLAPKDVGKTLSLI